MKREDGDAPLWIQPCRNETQKSVERGELVVYGDAQSLEDLANVQSRVAFEQGLPDGVGQFQSRGKLPG